jgi:hypothetical protein
VDSKISLNNVEKKKRRDWSKYNGAMKDTVKVVDLVLSPVGRIQTENVRTSEKKLLNHVFAESLGSKRGHLLDAFSEACCRVSMYHHARFWTQHYCSITCAQAQRSQG